MKRPPIYMDFNATTPVDQEVLDAMMPYFNQSFGNASSAQHLYGWEAEEAVEHAREQVADLIAAKPSEIVFTSGATEAINLAIKGSLQNPLTSSHLITAKSEHKAVLDTFSFLERCGSEVAYLEVAGDGLISTKELTSSLKGNTTLISVMHANNETGVIQDIAEISEIAGKNNVLVFTDATQSVGKIPVNVSELGIDLLAFSAHKIYGPKGAGALYIGKNSDVNLSAQIHGGGHERGYRSGTLNVPAIVGFGKACELAKKCLQNEGHRIEKLRNQLESELTDLGAVKINGQAAARLPNTSNVTFENIHGNQLMRMLKGLAVSQGSACNATQIEPSHVLKTMGLSNDLALSSIRISLGRSTVEADIYEAVRIIKEAVQQLRFQVQ